MRYVRPILPIVVAVGLGPLVAGLIFCILAVAGSILDGSTSVAISDLEGLFFLYIVFSYLAGGPIALIAGVLMSLWMIRYPPGLLAAIGSALLSVTIFLLASTTSLLSAADSNLVRNNLGLTVVMSVLSASICWILLHRFASPAGTPQHLTSREQSRKETNP
jgi:hypothetical protein